MQDSIRPLCATCLHRPLCLPSGLTGDAEKEMASILGEDLLLRKGEALSKRTRVTGRLFVVRSGAFKSETSLRAGAQRVLGIHEAGDFMSTEPTFGGIPGAEYIALQSSSVCVVDPWKLQALAAKHPALGAFIVRITADALARAQQASFALGSLHAPERLAWLLLDLSERRRRRGMHPLALSLPLTGRDVANYLGFRPETVSRTWGAMERNGLIARHGQGIQILKFDRLTALVPGCGAGVPARTVSISQTTPAAP